MAKKRRQRSHGLLPAGFVWRDGRPRWLPSPTRRRQGWSPVDLARQARGEKVWLTKAEAIERCEQINAAVKAWTDRGDLVPADFKAFAPANSTVASAAPIRPVGGLSARSIGALMDAYTGTADGAIKPSPRFAKLAASTQGDYRSKLKRLLVALVESEDPAKLEAVRALDVVDTLTLPDEECPDEPFALEDAYEWLRENAGENMAVGVMRTASAWLTWCAEKKRIRALLPNPVTFVEMQDLKGRIRVGSTAEISALVKAADELGHHSVGDAIVFGLDLGWSRKDLLKIQVTDIVGHLVRGRRAKTDVATETPLLEIGRARLEQIRDRRRNATVTSPYLIACERTGGKWADRSFWGAWDEVRERAAKDVPSVADFQFMDMRDTAITLCREARMSVEQTCSRSQHKPTRVMAVWEKHYGSITPEIAESGAQRMDEHMALKGWTAALT